MGVSFRDGELANFIVWDREWEIIRLLLIIAFTPVVPHSRMRRWEQNPEKPNQWGKLARAGHQVVQFRDLSTQKYVAVAVDGKVKEYAR